MVVDENGNLTAAVDALRPNGQATITAISGVASATCKTTIVDWTANRLQLELASYLTDYNVTEGLDGALYSTYGLTLYKSTDDFVTKMTVGALPATTDKKLLFTPHGVILRGEAAIYKSVDDMQTWTLCIDGLYNCLYHAFDYYYDAANELVYVYTGEYTMDYNTRRCRVIRGVIESDGSETWTTAIEFYTPDEYTADPVGNIPSAHHIHLVTVDQATGRVYAGTGDGNPQCNIVISNDHGVTWQTLGTGAQKWRTLSMWFTDDYVYWNMDTSAPQSIWRLARANLSAQEPENDLSAEVQKLNNGSHWYHCWGKDDQGRDIVIMAQAQEGQIRDWMSRVYGIRELVNGNVEIQELLAARSNTPDVYTPMAQFEPQLQHGDYIYLNGRQLMDHNRLWKMRFVREAAPA